MRIIRSMTTLLLAAAAMPIPSSVAAVERHLSIHVSKMDSRYESPLVTSYEVKIVNQSDEIAEVVSSRHDIEIVMLFEKKIVLPHSAVRYHCNVTGDLERDKKVRFHVTSAGNVSELVCTIPKSSRKGKPGSSASGNRENVPSQGLRFLAGPVFDFGERYVGEEFARDFRLFNC